MNSVKLHDKICKSQLSTGEMADAMWLDEQVASVIEYEAAQCDNELARQYIRDIEKAEREKAFNNM